MTKNSESIKNAAAAATTPTKHQQIIDLLSREGGASLEEMATSANWLTRSTRAYLTGLKKRGFELTSDKVEGVRRYQITKAPAA